MAAPTSAAGYQAMFDALNTSAWSGADNASTVALPGGDVLWLFGDTMQGAQAAGGGYAPGWRMVHSSAVVQHGGCLTPVTGPGKSLLPDRPDGLVAWPTVGVLDAGRLWVFADLVRLTPGVAPGFLWRGTSVTALTATSAPTVVSTYRTPSDGVLDTDGPQWGAAVLRQGVDLFVYGTRRSTRTLELGSELYVAKVPSGHLADLSAWRYWDGSAWSTRQADAAVVLGAAGGVSNALSVVSTPRGVMAVSKVENVFGDGVGAWSASSPVGPFVRTSSLADGAPAGAGSYLAYAHPEIRLADASMLVSVCRNTADLAVLLADADLYKPQFLSAVPPAG